MVGLLAAMDRPSLSSVLALVVAATLLTRSTRAWRSELGLVLVDPAALLFVVDGVSVGGQPVLVEIDTGSSRSWIPAAALSTPTLNRTTTPFRIAYRDGSRANGVVASDLVQFGPGGLARRSWFGLVSHDTTIVGYGVIAARPAQLRALLEGADAPVASFAFAERRLALGQETTDGFAWIASDTADRWTITASVVRFGSCTASAASFRVDTGAAIVGVPDSVYEQMRSTLGADSNGFVADCERRWPWWPPFQIELGDNLRLTYPPAAWMRPVADRPGLCRVVFRRAGQDWILGVPLLMQQAVAFRVRTPGQAEVGFRT